GGSEGHARIWDVKTGRQVDAYTTNGSPVFAVAMRAGGKEILIGEGEADHAYIAYWEPATLNPGHLDMGDVAGRALGYGPSGGDLLPATRNGVRRIPVAARRSNLAATSPGYTSMFGFSLPEKAAASPSPR